MMAVSVGPKQSREILSQQENWELIKRLATALEFVFQQDDYTTACEKAFQSAVEACQKGEWVRLEKAREDIERISSFLKTSLINYALSRGENEWVSRLI